MTEFLPIKFHIPVFLLIQLCNEVFPTQRKITTFQYFISVSVFTHPQDTFQLIHFSGNIQQTTITEYRRIEPLIVPILFALFHKLIQCIDGKTTTIAPPNRPMKMISLYKLGEEIIFNLTYFTRQNITSIFQTVMKNQPSISIFLIRQKSKQLIKKKILHIKQLAPIQLIIRHYSTNLKIFVPKTIQLIDNSLKYHKNQQYN